MILQKMFLLRGLSLLLILGCFSMVAQGQCNSGAGGGRTIDNGTSGTFTVLKLCDTHPPGSISLCGPQTIPVELNQFCSSAKAPIPVYAVNLIDLDPGTPEGTVVEWPLDQYLPVHLKYEYDGLQSIVPTFLKYSMPIQEWKYLSEITVSVETKEGAEERRFNLFKGIMPVNIGPLANLECGSGSSYQIQGMDVEVVQIPSAVDWVKDWKVYNEVSEEFVQTIVPGVENDPFDHYPISEYGGDNEIFSSLVFTDNCDACVDPPIARDTLTFCVECPNCPNEDPLEGGPEGGQFRQQANASSSGIKPLSINPNPFSTYTQYQYFSKEETNIQVSLFSTDGVAVLQQIQKVGIGENTYRLDTHAIPEGAYYLQVKTNMESYMKLIVKIN